MSVLLCSSAALGQSAFQPPVSYEDAGRRAEAILARMSPAEKLELISGHRSFYIRGFPQYGVPELYLSDATQGVHLRDGVGGILARSTAFPCALNLAATWDPDLAYRYARAVGEECRAGGIAILLGPGFNIYRTSQGGRNFEFFGEDPFLVARLVERYVRGVLDTGTIPTLKHFVANNTDYHRRTSNSIVDERTLREIYLPGFQAGVDAGAMAVMTAYNQLNGEWCGQDPAVITQLLRTDLGFRWMVMTDWWSVWDAQKIMTSGQDLEMPGEKFIQRDGARLVAEGKVPAAAVDRMAKAILRTEIAMGFHDRPIRDQSYLAKFPEHAQIALATAREGIVLLKNDGLLPLRPAGPGRILLTGRFVTTLARGGGSADVAGYDVVTLGTALAEAFGPRLEIVAQPTDEQLRRADVVLVSTGTNDSEGWDRPFPLPADEEAAVERAVRLNPHTVVLVNSGGGIEMTGWNDRAAAVVYAWYPGQVGNRALAEVLSGRTNPSGKLPITIERRFADSPACGDIPPGEGFYTGWDADSDMNRPIRNIVYREGVFVGYRWYEARRIAPLYAFGHGLSYTSFNYQDLAVAPAAGPGEFAVEVAFTVANSGATAGADVAQIYVRPTAAPVPRPEKELKGFAKVYLEPGERRLVRRRLAYRDFAYWDVGAHRWAVAPGTYHILVGGASDAIRLDAAVTVP